MIYLDKGYIGCFEMPDKDTGKRQLESYVRQLKHAGHGRIIAPINGDTWHTYRLASWSSGSPAFPLEPQNPLWYNDVFEECGFTPLKKYRSDTFCIKNITLSPNTDRALRFRDFRDGDLEFIYKISLRGFDENFLYSDITFEEFNKLYQPVLPMIDNELAVIAEIDNAPVGFMFSFAIGDTQILKTMAVLPEFRSKRIGTKMMNHVLLAGQRKGLVTAVAALMAEGNNSFNIISKYEKKKIREYTLYCLETQP
jgi:GNAT superfamily N-acetyltransferase